MKNLKWVLAVLTAVVLTGCGDDKGYVGETSVPWISRSGNAQLERFMGCKAKVSDKDGFMYGLSVFQDESYDSRESIPAVLNVSQKQGHVTKIHFFADVILTENADRILVMPTESLLRHMSELRVTTSFSEENYYNYIYGHNINLEKPILVFSKDSEGRLTNTSPQIMPGFDDPRFTVECD